MALRVLMMGTGTFALPTFRDLLDSNHAVVGLVTQPDRQGRGHHRHINELKQLAIQRDVPVFQPENVNRPESLQSLREFAADIFVVAAYGQILSKELLSIPAYGAVNLHGSLLPKYRGAAPVQYAVLNGETETGVTIFQIEPRLDSGPILGVVKTQIGTRETSGELHDRLAKLAAPLTLDVLDGLESQSIEFRTQDSEGVSKAPKITKADGLIHWDRRAEQIDWHVRGMQPWPGAFTFLHLPERSPQRIAIVEVESAPECGDLAGIATAPGVLSAKDGKLFVGTGSTPIEILKLQPAGKRTMQAAEFLRGTTIDGGRFADDNA